MVIRGNAMTRSQPTGSFLDHFSALKDPRQPWRVLYPLEEILLVALCATLRGQPDFDDVWFRFAKRRAELDDLSLKVMRLRFTQHTPRGYTNYGFKIINDLGAATER